MPHFRDGQSPTDLARTLRRNETRAERVIWERLRRRQINGCKCRRQHRVGRFVADFACPDAGLAIEIDGGQHARDSAEDQARTEALEQMGFRVLRFWNHDVLENADGVVRVIVDELDRAAPGQDPPPTPSLAGRGEVTDK